MLDGGRPPALSARDPHAVACHHDLRSDSWRLGRRSRAKPGRPEIRPWPLALGGFGFKVAGKGDAAAWETALSACHDFFRDVPFGTAKDLAQVRTTAEHFARLDEAGKLAAVFGPGKTAAADMVLDAEREEGWILGAGA